MDPLQGDSTGSDVLPHLGPAQLASIGLVDGVVLVIGQDPPAEVACHWLLSSLGGLRELMAKGSGGHWKSIHSSVASSPKKLTKSAGKGGVSPKSSIRSNQTCCLAGSESEHSVVDPGRKQGCPAARARVLSGCIWLTALFADTCHWGWRWRVVQSLVCVEWVWWAWGWEGMPEGSPGGSLGRCFAWKWVHWWLALVLPHSTPAVFALQLQAPHQGITSQMLGNLLSPAIWGWLAWDKEWAQEHFLPLDGDQAAPIAQWRPALIRCWPSSSWISAMNWSWSWQESMLDTTSYYPQWTCSATSRISWSIEPSRAPTDRWSGAISLAMAVWWEWGCLQVCCCCFLLFIAVALWSRCSSRNSPYFAAKLSSRKGVPSSAHLGIAVPWELTQLPFSNIQFEGPLLSLIPLKATKLPYCRVTISFILQ